MTHRILPSVIGHRGAAAHAPENTLAGLRKAAELGATWVEVDVMLSRDGQPLLHHDLDLARTTGVAGVVETLDYATIRQRDAGIRFAVAYAGERVPLLASALEVIAELGLGANIEIKPAPGRETETARVTLELLRDRWVALQPPLISSFSEIVLAEAERVAPDLPRGYLAERLPADWRQRVSKLGCATIHLGQNDLSQAAVVEVKQVGYELAVWTVNDAATARRFLAWGADCIITDVPDRILGVLSEQPERSTPPAS